MWTGFKDFTEFITVLLLFHGLVSCREACGISAPQPGMEPVPPALEAEPLTTVSPRKSPEFSSL